MGFLVGFISVAMIAGYGLLGGFSSICCRYCASSVLQNFAYGVSGDLAAMEYWHTGSIISLGFWLVLGGVFFTGGRGWCLFFCPLGALSGIAHSIGSKIGLYKVKYNQEQCKSCASCDVKCPAWAVGEDKSVEKILCIGCQECTKSCKGGAYKFGRGEKNA
jgi:polyferredoxin